MISSSGEHYDYIMEDEIIVRLPFVRPLSCTVCGLLKGAIGTGIGAFICHIYYMIWITM